MEQCHWHNETHTYLIDKNGKGNINTKEETIESCLQLMELDDTFKSALTKHKIASSNWHHGTGTSNIHLIDILSGPPFLSI